MLAVPETGEETRKRGQKERSQHSASNQTKTVLLLQETAEEPEEQPVILQRETEEDLNSVANSISLQTRANPLAPDHKAR